MKNVKEELLSIPDAASVIGVSRIWLFKMVREGRLPARQLGLPGRKRPLYLVRRQDLMAFQKEREKRPELMRSG